MEIRPAMPGEYDQIGEIIVIAYSELFAGELGGYETELRAVAERAADCTVLVAGEPDRMLGAVTYVPGPDTSMSEFSDPEAAGIRMLAVHPEIQGRGVGRALTSACIELARAAGKRRIVLQSTTEMAVARGMYQRMGFVAAPHLDIFYGDPPYTEANPLHLIAYVFEI